MPDRESASSPIAASPKASESAESPSARVSVGEVTLALASYEKGDDGAFEDLVALVYGDLRHLAEVQLAKREAGGFRTTDLVHELYLKLVNRRDGSWKDRRHFFAACATAMRNILIDAARAACSQKRGSGAENLPLAEAVVGSKDSDADLLLAVDQALSRLQEASPRLAKVFELHYFGGYSSAEVAEILETSRRTAQREWKRARAWIRGAVLPSEVTGTTRGDER